MAIMNESEMASMYTDLNEASKNLRKVMEQLEGKESAIDIHCHHHLRSRIQMIERELHLINSIIDIKKVEALYG